MADPTGKPTAQSFSAGINKEVGASPLHWNDKCFLCGVLIGETDPRGFYSGSSSMMLCHRGCLNIMDANGGKPADYHRAVAERDRPTVEQNWDVPVKDVRTGPSWLDFPDLDAIQGYLKSGKTIPATVKVTIAGVVIQGGDG